MNAITLPGFDVLEKMGESAVTEVWKAFQQSVRRVVTLKTPKPQFASDAAMVAHFIREAKAVASIKHANLVQLYDILTYEGLPYLVMEYVGGHTVADILAAERSLACGRALEIALRVSEVLAAAWAEAGLLHRNINPRSIRIDEDGTVKLVHLGFSVRTDPSDPAKVVGPDEIAGIPNYMAPEQIRCDPTADFHADMYGLGATLYHMLTGKMPFAECAPEAVLEKQLAAQIPFPCRVSSTVTRPAASVVTNLMMKDPADRYNSWHEAVDDIAKAASGRVLLRVRSLKPRKTSTVAAPAGAMLQRRPAVKARVHVSHRL
jgi:serine/threonine-protein kinase